MRILKMRLVNKGSLLAGFDLELSNKVIIRKMRLLDSGKGKWVSVPDEMVEKDGKKEYFPLITFEDPEVKKEFLRHAKEAAIKEYDSLSKSSDLPNLPPPNDEDVPF